VMSKNVQKRHIVLLLGVVIMAAFIALNGPSQVAHASGHYEISVYVVSVESYETDNHAELSVRARVMGCLNSRFGTSTPASLYSLKD